jgi:hypothetical protein
MFICCRGGRSPEADDVKKRAIPLIRAGAIRPFLTWMRPNDMPVDALLREAELAAGDQSTGEIAASLGYQRQSSLTRAVRRWSGTTPRQLRPKKGDPTQPR